MVDRTGQSWGVLGGGILGLTLARELARAGARVTVCEAAPELGGLASAWQVGPITWDRHYHVTLASDAHTRALLAELDLEKELVWRKTRTGFFVDGKLYSMSNALEFLRFPPLGLAGKLRLGGTIFYASRTSNWRQLEDVPVGDWLARLSGRRTFEKVWLPLLRSKLGESYRDVSAAFIWATINRLYAARRAGLKEELFGYVPGGYRRVFERLGAQLESLGVELLLGARLDRVRQESGALTVQLADGRERRFDRVVVTAPAPVAARVCDCLPPAERDRLAAIRYQGIVCASLVLTRPLGGYYVTNITDHRVPFTGVIEMSALVDPAEFGGRHLVYLPKYVAPDDAALEKPDNELRSEFLGGLKRMYPDLDEQRDVVAFRVSRVRNVFALPVIGYSRTLPAVRTSVPGLSILNSAHIVNATLNVNESIALALREVGNL